MEDIQEPVIYLDRLLAIQPQGTGTVMYTISELMEMAYLAGLNKVNIREGIKNIEDTGEARTLARNYVRDKGFPI